MVIVRFTKPDWRRTQDSLVSMVHFGRSDKGVKTQIEAPKEKHHSSMRDSSVIVSCAKDAINHAIILAPADLI